MSHPVQIRQCPYCGGTEFVEGYQSGHGAVTGAVTGKESILTSQFLRHIICRTCGSVVHSYIDNPEKLFKIGNRRS